ncbi:MAG: hypothetical protein N3F65_00125 [Nitrososphaeria archaeon]|nr:hypothetical protein [Nitrososphaeria archaeon]
MSYRRQSTLEKFIKGLRSEAAERLLLAILIIFAMAFFSGVTYSLVTKNPISIIYLEGGVMRIFVWSLLMQTHAETIVVFIYYAIGFSGLLLYVRAVSRPSDPRTTKYMLFFSFILLLLASLGLYNAFIEKFIAPS